MKHPTQQDKAFLSDVRASRDDAGLHLWWLGQSGFLVQWRGRHALIDPYLSDSLTKKYAGTDTPHVRITERVVAPERLDFIDVVSSSHNHTDHLDADTLIPLLRVNPELTVIVPEANRTFAADRLRVDPGRITGLTVRQSITVDRFTFHPVPAAHEALEQDEFGHYTHFGYVIEMGPWTVYHSGDTVWYDGIVDELDTFDIDVAILPINGSDPDRGVAGNLNGEEAVELAQQIDADLVVPCHFDMFEFNTVAPDEFVAAAEAAGQRYRVMGNGERMTLSWKRGNV